jgi:hypothetical protein
MSADPYGFLETERRELSLQRESRAELAARVCPPDPWVRPDVIESRAGRLRQFAADLIKARDGWLDRSNGRGTNWRAVAHDTPEVRDLCRELAEVYGPFIDKALADAEKLEREMVVS